MTVEEMQAQLDKMKDDIEHMKVRVSEYEHMISVIKAQGDKKFERVSKNENYFTLMINTSGMIIDSSKEKYDWIDDARFDNNNYFKTAERAQEVADKINFLLKLERLRDTFCPDYVPDWDDWRVKKWEIDYENSQGRYRALSTPSTESKTAVYFPTEEIAQKVCDIFNKECESNDKS